jgi:hypothetical protein
MPLSRSGFITAAILGFTHTVGEFGVVLMIGGNIPGKTRVVSVQIYNHVEALEYSRSPLAGRRFAGVLVYRTAGALHCAENPTRCPSTKMTQPYHCPLSARLRRLSTDGRPELAGFRRHRAVWPFRLRQNHAAALHRRAAASAAQGFLEINGTLLAGQ